MALFHVSVHDVAPPWLPPLREIARALAPRVGPALSLAVVPAWHGTPLDARRDRALIDLVQCAGAELHQHGLTHHADGGGGAVGRIIGRTNELFGLGRAEALGRLVRGHALLTDALGQAPTGLVPPAWDAGPIGPDALAELGVEHLITLVRARSASGAWLPLASYSWDAGFGGPVGLMSEGFGRSVAALVPRAVPHVVLHPLDVERGWLGRALGRIDALLERGLRPARWAEIFAGARG